WAAVTDFGLHHISHSAHAHRKNSVARNRVHRVHAIAYEIDQNLLNLDAIERDRWMIAFDVFVDTDATTRRLLGHEAARLGNDASERRGVPRLKGLSEQGPDAADDLRCGVGVADDPLDS